MPKSSKRRKRRRSRNVFLTTDSSQADTGTMERRKDVRRYQGFNIRSPQVVDESVVTVQMIKRNPVNSILNPMKFTIREKHLWTDFNKSYIVMSLKLVKPNGDDFADHSKVGLINNIPFSIFSSLIVTVNGQQIGVKQEGDFPLIQWMKQWLKTNSTYEHTVGPMIGWTIDQPADKVDTADDDNTGWTARNTRFQDSAIITLELRLSEIDLFSGTRAFPPQVKVELTFKPADNTFYVHGVACKLVHTEDPVLITHHTVGEPSLLLPIEQSLSQNVSEYRFEGWTLQSYQIPIGFSQHTYTIVYDGKLPRWFALGLSGIARANGTITTTPFKFEKFNLATVHVDGAGGEEKTDYTDLQDRDKSYRRFMNKRLLGAAGTSTADLPKALWDGITPFHITDVSPDEGLTPGVYYPRPEGQLRITLKFSQPLAAAIQARIFCVHDSCLRIDMHGTTQYLQDL